MIVQTYSLKPLPIELRKDFELPVWPYEPEYFEEFEAYMNKYDIIRYQDNEVEDSDGTNIDYSINFKRPELEIPFKAYYNKFMLSNDTLKTFEWPLDQREGMVLHSNLQDHKVHSDNIAWVSWNVVVAVHIWTTNMIAVKYFDMATETFETNSKCRTVDNEKYE